MMARLTVVLGLLAVGASAQQPCGPCGDVAPRMTGDGVLTVGDVIVTLRFATGLETPVADELRRADVAPAARWERAWQAGVRPEPLLVTGDGSIDVADVIVLLRAAVASSTFVLPEPPEIVSIIPDQDCLSTRGMISIHGRNLLVGFEMPEVEVDGEPVLWPSGRAVPGEHLPGGLDRLTVIRPELDPAPPGGRLVSVRIRTAAGEAELPEAYRISGDCEEAPVIDSLTPTEGVGNSILTLTGSGLGCVVSVEAKNQWDFETWYPEILAHHLDGSLSLLAPQPGPPLNRPERNEWTLTVISACGSAEAPAPFTHLESQGDHSLNCPSFESWTHEIGEGRPVVLRAAPGESFREVDWILWDEMPGTFIPPIHRSDQVLVVPGLGAELFLWAGDDLLCGAPLRPSHFARPDPLTLTVDEKSLGESALTSFYSPLSGLADVETILFGELVLRRGTDFSAGDAVFSVPDPIVWPTEDLTVDVVAIDADGWRDLTPVPFTYRVP